MELFDKKILEQIGKSLIRKQQTIAVAESVTSGLLQFSFSNIPDAADFFQGGLTAYNLGQKFKHLAVEPLHAKKVNCVSQKVANEMALQVAAHYTSDWGIGITGYATPVEESGNQLFAYYAIALKDKIQKRGLLKTKKTDPPEVQRDYVNMILKHLSPLLK